MNTGYYFLVTPALIPLFIYFMKFDSEILKKQGIFNVLFSNNINYELSINNEFKKDKFMDYGTYSPEEIEGLERESNCID